MKLIHILIVAMLVVPTLFLGISSAQGINSSNIGDAETHSSYYFYGNMTVNANSTLDIINENFYFFGQSIRIYGKLTLISSTIYSQEANLSVIDGTLDIYSSVFLMNGSIYVYGSDFSCNESRIGNRNSVIGINFLNSMVSITNSSIFGQQIANELNFTSMALFNNSYQPFSGNIDLKSITYVKAFVNEVVLNVEYQSTNSTSAYLRLNVSGKNFMYHFSNSSVLANKTAEFDLSKPVFDPSIVLTYSEGSSNVRLYGVSLSERSNDTYDYYGQSRFNIVFKNTTALISHSLLALTNGSPFIYYHLRNYRRTGLALYNSTVFLISSASSYGDIESCPIISFNSRTYYFEETNITNSTDGLYFGQDKNVFYSNLTRYEEPKSLLETESFMDAYVLGNPLLVWIYNGTFKYYGNYAAKVYSAFEYFSIKPFPDLTLLPYEFNVTYKVPLISISGTINKLVSGAWNNFTFLLSDSYVSSRNVSLNLYIENKTTNVLIASKEGVYIGSGTEKNETFRFYLNVDPGSYDVVVTVNESIPHIGLYAYDFPVNVSDDVNLTFSYEYSYLVPFTNLSLKLYLENKYGVNACGTLEIFSGNASYKKIYNDIPFNIEPENSEEYSMILHSSKAVRNLTIVVNYGDNMHNLLKQSVYVINLKPLFLVYRVNFHIVGNYTGSAVAYISNKSIDIVNESGYTYLPNGTYALAIWHDSAYSLNYTHTFSVNGAILNITIEATPITYEVIFRSYLNVSWYGYLQDRLVENNSVLYLQNGSYALHVSAVKGYYNTTISFNISGRQKIVMITLSPFTYFVSIFSEPSIYPFTIAIDRRVVNITHPGYTLHLSTGTYKIIGLGNANYTSTFFDTVTLSSNLSLTIQLVRKESNVTIRLQNYTGNLTLELGKEAYNVKNGSVLRIVYGLYTVRTSGNRNFYFLHSETVELYTENATIYINASAYKNPVTLSFNVPVRLKINNMSTKGQVFDMEFQNGTYYALAYAPGYRPLSILIEVNGSESLNYTMKQFTYAVSIISNIKGFNLSLGSRYYTFRGRTASIDLPNGTYTAVFEKRGYAQSSIRIIVDGSDISVSIIMHKITWYQHLLSYLIKNIWGIMTVSAIILAIYVFLLRRRVYISVKSIESEIDKLHLNYGVLDENNIQD